MSLFCNGVYCVLSILVLNFLRKRNLVAYQFVVRLVYMVSLKGEAKTGEHIMRGSRGKTGGPVSPKYRAS